MALYQQSSSDDPNKDIDEIKRYYDCQYISPCEAFVEFFVLISTIEGQL